MKLSDLLRVLIGRLLLSPPLNPFSKLGRIQICFLFAAVFLFCQGWMQYSHRSDSSHAGLQYDDLNAQRTARLTELAAHYNQERVFSSHHLDLGPSVSALEYSATLDRAAKDVFSFASRRWAPVMVRQAVQRARDPLFLFDTSNRSSNKTPYILGMPRTIATTIRNKSEMPKEFAGWQRLNKNWQLNIFDDDDMLHWMRGRFSTPKLRGWRATPLLDAYNRMPRPVLRSDLFRYALVFLEGGMYSDSDTSAVRPISDWDNSTIQDWTDPSLADLDLRAQAVAHVVSNGQEAPPMPISQAPPALVVSIETSTTLIPQEGEHLVQWTFGGLPGHPVFLDLLQRVVEVSRHMDELCAAGDNTTWMTDRSVFTWTGPEIWSAAVWRYLWARFGFDFRRMQDVTHPVRVGDVLILPFNAFAAAQPVPHLENTAEARVWHGFMGTKRWRIDNRNGNA